MSVIITLTTVSNSVGPFNIYSDVDSFFAAFKTNVPLSELVIGYPVDNIPVNTAIIRVKSVNSTCSNYIDTNVEELIVIEEPETPVDPGQPPAPIVAKPKIGTPTLTVNNNCETVFEGSYRVPEGTTATVIGTQLQNWAGGGTPGTNGVNTFYGTTTVASGIYPYTVDLGNSGVPGTMSAYTLKVILNNGEEITRLFQRTSFNSVFYDNAPC